MRNRGHGRPLCGVWLALSRPRRTPLQSLRMRFTGETFEHLRALFEYQNQPTTSLRGPMTTLSINLPETQTPALDVSLRGRIGGPCRMCGAELKHVVVDLGMSPLCEDFRSSEQIDGPETYMPLKAVACDQCYL